MNGDDETDEVWGAATIEACPAGIFRSDVLGRCVSVNRAWLALTGQTREQALGEGWQRSIHPDDLERVKGAFFDAIAEREPVAIEMRTTGNDGVPRWIVAQAGARELAAAAPTGKPFTKTTLERALATALEGRPAAD